MRRRQLRSSQKTRPSVQSTGFGAITQATFHKLRQTELQWLDAKRHWLMPRHRLQGVSPSTTMGRNRASSTALQTRQFLYGLTSGNRPHHQLRQRLHLPLSHLRRQPQRRLLRRPVSLGKRFPRALLPRILRSQTLPRQRRRLRLNRLSRNLRASNPYQQAKARPPENYGNLKSCVETVSSQKSSTKRRERRSLRQCDA